MKLETKYYIDLDLKDRETILIKAFDIDQGISRDEFIDYIEGLMNNAIDLMNK